MISSRVLPIKVRVRLVREDFTIAIDRKRFVGSFAKHITNGVEIRTYVEIPRIDRTTIKVKTRRRSVGRRTRTSPVCGSSRKKLTENFELEVRK